MFGVTFSHRSSLACELTYTGDTDLIRAPAGESAIDDIMPVIEACFYYIRFPLFDPTLVKALRNMKFP